MLSMNHRDGPPMSQQELVDAQIRQAKNNMNTPDRDRFVDAIAQGMRNRTMNLQMLGGDVGGAELRGLLQTKYPDEYETWAG